MHRIAITVVAVTLAIGVAVPAGASSAQSRDSSRTCPEPPGFDPADFGAPIDNPYFPLKPGTTYRYKGESEGEPTVDVFAVTHETKVIEGVVTTVIHDRGYVNDKLEEDTLDWYAQDKDGNVWYFGEDTKQIKRGRVVGTEGSWEAGKDGAEPGIFMPARPKVGQVLRQEDAPGVAEDCFKILDLNASVKTPFVSSKHALRTKEFTSLEPGVIDEKYYVRGVGMVRDVNVKPGEDELKLVSVKRG